MQSNKMIRIKKIILFSIFKNVGVISCDDNAFYGSPRIYLIVWIVMNSKC